MAVLDLNPARRIVDVRRLIENGADVNVTNDAGETPLFIASKNGYENIVESLIAARADVNKADNNGKTPLYIATVYGRLSIIERLLTAGGDISKADIQGETPLYVASRYDRLATVERLLLAGADVNKATSNTGATPLYVASQQGHLDVVETLLAAGADVNATTHNGETPLFAASFYGNLAIVERLLAAGADVNATTHNGETPLFAACMYQRLKIVVLLLKAGADKTIADKRGRLPIDVATPDIRKLLESRPLVKGPVLKWQGWTRGDASMLDGVFGDDDTAKNFALCPVCMKYVERSEACMYMSHNCSETKGYYHEDLYEKYMNSAGIINWCTICGRICKGHNHFNLAPAQGPVPTIIYGKDPFAKSCEGEGGGGVTEKLLRFRRLREHAKELQAEVGKMGWWEAMDKLCEEMWNAPMVPTNALRSMQAEKKYNIPNTNFPLRIPPVENAPNVPYAGEAPLVHPEETDTFTNAFYMDDANILQFRHKRSNGEWNRHEGPEQQISREGFVGWLKDMMGNPTGPGFGKCWQYKTTRQQAALNAAQKALVCDAVLHPEEVKAALDMEDAEHAKLAEGYRKAFNAAFDVRKMYRP